ncbi:hypothetical protein B2A_13464, partial [mine drainage metagenome]
TFSLAMHAWDQPAERLLELSVTSRARLMMPRIGEPVEPQEASGRLEPWWRGVEGVEGPPGPAEGDGTRSIAMPLPMD